MDSDVELAIVIQVDLIQTKSQRLKKSLLPSVWLISGVPSSQISTSCLHQGHHSVFGASSEQKI
jgi:hypothetical protein